MKPTFCCTAAVLVGLAAGTARGQQYKPLGEIRRADANSTLNMHLCPDGKWAVGEDAWGKIVRVNMLKITDADWPEVPGVKKAWRMQGFEGEEGMAFHPIMSEVKDVDGDGKPDIFRLRSEHAGAQIERVRYGDGSVVWVSEPVGALYGDESRLAVFDLHGNGEFSVVYADKGGLYCLDAHSGETRWKVHAVGGDFTVGRFQHDVKQGVVVHRDGVIRGFDWDGNPAWTYDTGLRGGDTYAHELMRGDADGNGRDEIFVNMQRLTLALRGDGTLLWEDKTQKHHSDVLELADITGDGRKEFIYDHEGCSRERGPLYIVDAVTGERRFTIDYRRDGLRHAQNMAVGQFDKNLPGLQIALCGKRSELAMWDSQGKLVWQRSAPTSLLSKGDFNGDGAEEIMVFGLGANVDGIFSVWNGQGERLYAVSFFPSPSKRTWSDKHNGGSWSHAMPGGHEGIRRQVDLDGNGRADVIMPFGAWHWGSDSILFLMEGPTPETAGDR